LKKKVISGGSEPWDQLVEDLAAKARSICWKTAWVPALVAIGDSASARELSAVLAEEEAHRDALQQGLNRLIEHRGQGFEAVKAQL